MLTDWFSQNGGTLLVSVILIAVVGAVVFRMIRNRKKGISTCGCGCSECAASSVCHKEN